MIKKKTPDSNVPQILDISSEESFLKVTLILPATKGIQKGKSKVVNYSELKKFSTSFLIWDDENNPKELLIDARLYTNK